MMSSNLVRTFFLLTAVASIIPCTCLLTPVSPARFSLIPLRALSPSQEVVTTSSILVMPTPSLRASLAGHHHHGSHRGVNKTSISSRLRDRVTITPGWTFLSSVEAQLEPVSQSMPLVEGSKWQLLRETTLAQVWYSYFESCSTVRCHHRDIVKIDKARPWWRSLLTEGRDGARL